jgi:hypothetical protein
MRLRGMLASSVMLSWFACAGTEPPVETSGGQIDVAKGEALCVSGFKRQRECTDEFLPALVDLRVRLDKPAGIAAAAKSEGKEALIAVAREEWAGDSTDEAIAKTCAQKAAKMPASEELYSALSNCLAAPSCAEFVPCQIDFIEGRLVEE